MYALARKLVPWLLLALIALLFGYALSAGSLNLSAKESWAVVLNHLGLTHIEGVGKVNQLVVWDIRLPRLMLAMLSGAALAGAGMVYQGVFRNPLVEPYLLGISSGAALGASLSIVFPMIFTDGQLTSFLFSLGAVSITYLLAHDRKTASTPPVALILSGVLVGAIFSACVAILKYVSADTELREITFWLMGGFYYASWEDVKLNAFWILPALALMLIMSKHLNIMSLGDEQAISLGLNPTWTRIGFLLISTLAASVCVSTVGIIAWVGLMMPHAARMMVGPDHRYSLINAMLLGALYMLICDTLARTLTDAEIPIAIVTSLVGAPYLLWLIKRNARTLNQYG